MQQTSFYALQTGIDEIRQITNEILKQISSVQAPISHSNLSVWMNPQELSEFHPDHPAIQTIYKWVHYKKIPYHKGGKKLRFLRSEILEWLQEGQKKTLTEIPTEAIITLKRKGGKYV